MTDTTARDRTALTLMLDAGLRAAETCALLWEDIDLPQALLRVHGKGARDRIVPVTYEVMHRLRADRGPADQLVWHTRRRPPSGITTRALHNIVVRAGDDLGFHLHCHMLRHTYATDLMRASVNLRDIQSLLGHASLATTAIYTHVEPTELAARLRRALANPPQLTLRLLEG